jgi:hypothetical protein
MFRNPDVPAHKFGCAQPGAPDLHIIIPVDIDPAVIVFCAWRRRYAHQERLLCSGDLVQRITQSVRERLRVLPMRVKVYEYLAAARKRREGQPRSCHRRERSG